MKLFQKLLISIVVIALCVGAVLAGRTWLPKPENKNIDKRALTRTKGSSKADLWIVSYSDFECGACRMGNDILKEWLQKYPNRIYIQSRYYPLINSHVHALKSSIYAECAAEQGKYWPMYEKLFEQQATWGPAKEVDDMFENYASEVGVNLQKLRICVDNPEVKAYVLKDRDTARALGGNSTPTYFVNGRKIVGPMALTAELQEYFSEKK